MSEILEKSITDVAVVWQRFSGITRVLTAVCLEGQAHIKHSMLPEKIRKVVGLKFDARWIIDPLRNHFVVSGSTIFLKEGFVEQDVHLITAKTTVYHFHLVSAAALTMTLRSEKVNETGGTVSFLVGLFNNLALNTALDIM